MSRKSIKNLTIAILVVALISFFTLMFHYSSKAKDIKGKMARQLYDAKIERDRKLDAQRKEFQKEFEDACGGKCRAIATNPELNITEMIKRVAFTAAPAGSKVSVSVDNFTIIDVTITPRKAMRKTEAAELMLKILGPCKNYLNSILVISKNVGISSFILDRAAIDKVGDMENIDLEGFKKLLNINR